mgnify:CR=1 FL=1
MKTVFRWVGIVFGVLVGLIILTIGAIYFITESRINKTYDIQVETVAIPTDAATIEYGKHVATIRACIECHGEDLGGKIYIEDPAVGRLVTSNLTAGKNGSGSSYTDADYVRAIRHGVGSDGKPLLLMPSLEFYYLSDADLGAVIAYVKSVPPVDSDLPRNQVALPLRAIYLFSGEVGMLSAEVIDHESPPPIAPEAGVTDAYGEYLAVTCTGCHGKGLSGGPIPGAPPGWPEALNLTPGGELIGWSEPDFIAAMRTGVTPAGRQLRNEFMPWKVLGQMTDDELRALWLYLQSAPAKEQGNR